MVRLPVLLAAGLAALLAACVAYRPAPVDASRVAEGIGRLRPGPLPFAEAVRALVDRNPELRRLRAEAAAVNLEPAPGPLEASAEVLDGRLTETVVGADLLSLLGLGPRREERALARARRHEALQRHHGRARELVAALAVAYAEESALGRLASPRPALDVTAFRESGLASRVHLVAAEAALAEAAAEEALVGTARREARREIARLLGAGPDGDVEPVPVAADWPPVPPADARDLLLARGDLQELEAAYEVADRRLRLAVARQWPGLVLHLGAEVHAGDPLQIVAIRLPVGAAAEARAMARAREAARRALEAGVLDALHDAASARRRLEAARAVERGAGRRREAAAALVRAAQARVASDGPQAFGQAVLAALEEVRAAAAWREAIQARARARVEAARAAGWPGPPRGREGGGS